MTKNKNSSENQAENKPQPSIFSVQRIYVKDMSFEAPNTPYIFSSEWEPNIHFNIETKVNNLDDHNFEVVLFLSITTELGPKDKAELAFICEVQQAGIFHVAGIEEPDLSYVLFSQCPNILYPYARAAIASLVTQGSFPQLNLDPINFDALYMDHLNKLQEKEKNKTEENAEKH